MLPSSYCQQEVAWARNLLVVYPRKAFDILWLPLWFPPTTKTSEKVSLFRILGFLFIFLCDISTVSGCRWLLLVNPRYVTSCWQTMSLFSESELDNYRLLGSWKNFSNLISLPGKWTSWDDTQKPCLLRVELRYIYGAPAVRAGGCENFYRSPFGSRSEATQRAWLDVCFDENILKGERRLSRVFFFISFREIDKWYLKVMTADVICVKISIYIRNISLIRVGIRFKYDIMIIFFLWFPILAII